MGPTRGRLLFLQMVSQASLVSADVDTAVGFTEGSTTVRDPMWPYACHTGQWRRC